MSSIYYNMGLRAPRTHPHYVCFTTLSSAKVALETSVASNTQQRAFMSLLLNLSQPEHLSQVFWFVCIPSILFTGEDPWELKCQPVLFIYLSAVPSNVSGMWQTFNRCLLNDQATLMRRHVPRVHFFIFVCSTYHSPAGDRAQFLSCQQNIWGLDRWNDLFKLHSWWVTDSHLFVRLQGSWFSILPRG